MVLIKTMHTTKIMMMRRPKLRASCIILVPDEKNPVSDPADAAGAALCVFSALVFTRTHPCTGTWNIRVMSITKIYVYRGIRICLYITLFILSHFSCSG